MKPFYWKVTNNIKNFNSKFNLFLLVVLLLLCITYSSKNNSQLENFQGFANVPNNSTVPNNIAVPNNNTELNNNIIDNNVDEVHHLYWTGGYDSTFRLCELLIDQKKTVQPLYVSLVLDNDCLSEESCNKLWLRRNRREEGKSMNKIRKALNEKFPETKQTLLPTIFVDEDVGSYEFNQHFDNLFSINNLWPRKRKIHQYKFLSKYAFWHKLPIDIGVIGIHNKSTLYNFLDKNLTKQNNNKIILNKNHPIGYLRFPLFQRPKGELLKTAKNNNYNDILKLSWSCWFPLNGKPCGKCPMCKERVIEHPDH